ncbi:CpaF family protein [Paenibacillus sp. FSL R5-0887]|jgi:pilus assembly protein CpaF|uniref:CpaF family protein n=1 Tax=Paenibacillus TaxID=44249 RepID=UPI00096F132A|nr:MULTISPECIES: CpaF family protein [Paenibacillus]MDH6425591.1 pilus assembly protein CpaF [Paenibacillus sp. PastH-4]MDH6441611.1 pilus assembly protein CpaF [Paenibacillus sp. PastF-4]MDH6529878.1 pilus assembly protein CpaF [Paenibacillus sp. PastH-3]OMD15718.1 pilus assembly protein [Paenibacillus odorifer]OMD27745.1 pilus assembly protein [Paenibacillus odorifer]
MNEEMFKALRSDIRAGLDVTSAVGNRELTQYIERTILDSENLRYLTAQEKHELVKRLFDSFRGLDVLQPLVDNPAITEIMINSHTEIFVEEEGQIRRLHLEFESSSRLEDIIQTVVSGVNRVVNDSSPIVDARLKDGSRVNIVLPPVALKGPAMTIRKFPETPMTMQDLVRREALSLEAAELLQILVAAKYNIFISGGTGSGKTTFLNALSQYIPPQERVITIEDSAELQIVTVPNLVSLETRNANTEGRGEISIRDLIRSSLRMRPNRIVVGEVRGAECLDMLQAMNTGHDGSLSSGHSNSAHDMVSRLETMVLSAAELPVAVVRQQISSAIDIFVHLSRLRDRSRRVMEISEVAGLKDGEVILNPLYEFQEAGEREGRVQGGLLPCGNPLLHTTKLRMAGVNSYPLAQ